MSENIVKNVFIVGSKGIPSKYGGFETFVENLTHHKVSPNIKYHIACLSDNNDEFEYNNSRCFNLKVMNIGPAKAVLYDIMSLRRVYSYIRKNKIQDATVYVLACRIGPALIYFKRKFENLGIPIYLNPDGHEWKRAKWNKIVQQYWKLSEKMMIKQSDLVICDSQAIQKYIIKTYSKYNPKTRFIAYGATVKISDRLDSGEDQFYYWMKKWEILSRDYYLIVGRFVPENNYELIIREFINSNTNKKLVIVTNNEKNKFYNELIRRTNFFKDERIKFVGTIYDQDLLYQVRKNAYAYLHGHEVGGTNPSLLEAMATTSVNILLDVEFNKEVGGNAALYFNKEPYSLVEAINTVERFSSNEMRILGSQAKARILSNYSWDLIIENYEKVFLGNDQIETTSLYVSNSSTKKWDSDEIHARSYQRAVENK